jgi:hypothetical protein
MPCPSSEHLTELLNELYEDREKLASIADLCYERATSEEFDWDTVANQFKEEFEEALEIPIKTSVDITPPEGSVEMTPPHACVEE